MGWALLARSRALPKFDAAADCVVFRAQGQFLGPGQSCPQEMDNTVLAAIDQEQAVEMPE